MFKHWLLARTTHLRFSPAHPELRSILLRFKCRYILSQQYYCIFLATDYFNNIKDRLSLVRLPNVEYDTIFMHIFNYFIRFYKIVCEDICEAGEESVCLDGTSVFWLPCNFLVYVCCWNTSFNSTYLFKQITILLTQTFLMCRHNCNHDWSNMFILYIPSSLDFE